MTTIEIAERMILSRRVNTPRVSCPVCADVVMVTPEEAAAFMGISVISIHARIETGEVHFDMTADGSLVVCTRSLA